MSSAPLGPEDPLFWDKDRGPLELDDYVRLHSDTEYRFIAQDNAGRARVVTAWLGTDQGRGLGDVPLIFGTAALVGPDDDLKVVDDLEWFAATEHEARENHARMLEAILAESDTD
jgi:hypothetical protein